MREGRREEADKLMRLAEATKVEVEHALFPKHPKWRTQRRTTRGRFAARGTSNTALEILRLPTVPRDVRANTARPPSRQLANAPRAGKPSGEDEVIWVCTKPQRRHKLQKRSVKREHQHEVVLCHHRNFELEQREKERRRQQDTEDVRCAAEARAADKTARKARKREKRKELARREMEEIQRQEAEKRESELGKLMIAQRREQKRQKKGAGGGAAAGCSRKGSEGGRS